MFQHSYVILGTRKLHLFVPVSKNIVEVRCYSISEASRKESVTLTKDNLSPETIVGFVTYFRDVNWWFARVLDVTQEVKLTFLYPPGPSSSYRYPQYQDICIVPIANILSQVDPRTRTGHVYMLTKKEIMCGSKKLQTILSQN